MSPIIVSVDKNSAAEKFGISPNMKLCSINGNKISDVLDYKFYCYDANLAVKVLDENNKAHEIIVNKHEGQDLGLNFETYLMDKAKSCSNKCIFCFIDQLPKNMRDTLYFKDDDARLSFLMGNYISLTNLSEEDVDRIVKMRISPVNVSVQTTNPELRVKMLNNKNAGISLDILEIFAQNDIEMNCQLVICRDVNDGSELKRSLNDLVKFYPAVHSISVVPAGLTEHRDGLFPLKPIDKKRADEIIDITEQFASECMEKFGTSLAFCGDELYIKAQRKLPNSSYYEDFTQFENGVGMLSLFCEEFMSAVEYEENLADIKIVPFSIATGTAAAPFLADLLDNLKAKVGEFDGNVYAVENKFFGAGVSVAGLVTGKDLINALKDKNIGQRVLISENMLRDGGDVFLDDVTLGEVSDALGVPVVPIKIDGGVLFDEIIGV